ERRRHAARPPPAATAARPWRRHPHRAPSRRLARPPPRTRRRGRTPRAPRRARPRRRRRAPSASARIRERVRRAAPRQRSRAERRPSRRLSLTRRCETSAMTSFVRDYGLIIVFLAIMLETSGLPLPGETVLVTAAVLASQGHFEIWQVIVVATLAAIVGDNIGYWLGRWLGRGFLQRYGPVRRFSDRVLPPTERFFRRYGGWAIFAARWFSGFRIAGAWAAGFARMHWWKFFIFNALGGAAWA